MIRLDILGQVRLRDASSRELTEVLAQPKRLALLAFLALARSDSQRRDSLLALFWPDLDAARARDALNQSLRFLRAHCGSECIRSRGVEEVVLDRSRLWCDAAAFCEAAAAGRHGEALDLYRGDLLEGLHASTSSEHEEWVARERSRLRGIAARSARRLAEEREKGRNFTTAVMCARRAVELADVDERAIRELIALLDRLGDRAGALHAYDGFAARLARQYDIAPSPETQELMARVRQRAAVNSGASGGPGTDFHRGGDVSAATEYEIESEIGSGGMATVFLAHDVKHGRAVAVKTLRPEFATKVGPDRFLVEIRLTARLAHPHILPLLDSGTRDGVLFFVTPFVEGESLRARLNGVSRLPVPEVVRLSGEITEALDYAHRLGVVHCDIKPENVLLADGHAIVADFGVARAISASTASMGAGHPGPPVAVGSPAYMSPEQARGVERADPRSDIYSLGCVMYELLSGRPPFDRDEPSEMLAAHATAEPLPIRRLRPDVPRPLAELVMQCLRKIPAERPASAARVLEMLNAAALFEHYPIAGRRRLLVAAAAVTLLGVPAGTAAWQWWGGALPPTADAATAAAPGTMRTLAILPFTTPDDSMVAHVDAMASAIVTGLGAADGIRVVYDPASPDSARRIDPLRYARDAGAEYVLTGSLQHANGILRVHPKLVKVSDGSLAWTAPYQGRLIDVFGIQDSIAIQVIRSLGLSVSPDRDGIVARGRRTSSAEAYGLYVAARRHLSKLNRADIEYGLKLVDLALVRDSAYADAWVLRSDLLDYLQRWPVPNSDSLRREERLALDRALALDSLHGYALSLRAWMKLDDWDFVGADADFKRSVRVSPGHADANRYYAAHLARMGKRDSALFYARRALALEPDGDLTGPFVYLGLLDTALRESDRSLAIDSSRWIPYIFRANILLNLGKRVEADTAAWRFYNFGAKDLAQAVGYAASYFARTGDLAAGRMMMQRLKVLEQEGHKVAPSSWASARLAVGDREGALAELERAVRVRDDRLILSLDLWYGSLEGDPRFEAVRRAVFGNRPRPRNPFR